MIGRIQIFILVVLATSLLLPSPVGAVDEREAQLIAYLDDYGDWMISSEFGPVWRPNLESVKGDWHPFLNGQWLYTDRGWFWESRDSFGWLTCHFGRWQWISEGSVGWIWVAGDEWASAWVAWRESEDVIGWGALPPGAGGIVGGSPWEAAVPSWQAFLFVPHQRLMAWDVGRYTTSGDAVARAVTEDARLVTVAEIDQKRWSVAGPSLTNIEIPMASLEVEFVERFPTAEEERMPFVGGKKITAYAPRLDLEKAFAWVPGNISSLDALLLEAERVRIARQRDNKQVNRANQAIPRQPVYRAPDNKSEPDENVEVRDVIRDPVIIYEQVVSNPWYNEQACQPNCGCPKCRPQPPQPEMLPGNAAQREQRALQYSVQREQVQRQQSAQDAQRERQRAAQERARRGRGPNSPRVPLGPGL